MLASHGALLLPRRKTYAAIHETCNYTLVEIGYPFGATGRKVCSLRAAAVAKNRNRNLCAIYGTFDA